MKPKAQEVKINLKSYERGGLLTLEFSEELKVPEFERLAEIPGEPGREVTT